VQDDVIKANNSRPSLISPYGGRLVNLIAAASDLQALKRYANGLPEIRLSERSVCDLELLASGSFSPLDRFVGKQDFDRILNEMRLTSGHVFPIPVVLTVNSEAAIKLGEDVALVDAHNERLAIMKVEEIYEWNFHETVRRLLGTEDLRHPLVPEMKNSGRFNVSGPLTILQLPRHHDFRYLRLTPAQSRERLAALGHSNVVAFQTRNPLHRAHEELTKLAVDKIDGSLLLHPAIGKTMAGDVDSFTRVRTYQALIKQYYDPSRTLLSLLPLAMRFAGPREAVWHAVIRRNFGANYFIVGRDHASPGVDSTGKPFYDPLEAKSLLEKFSSEIGVRIIPFTELVYLPADGKYVDAAPVNVGCSIALSGKQLREKYLNVGIRPPEWLVRPEVAEILMDAYPPKYRQGACVWFTGLSGSGKSTTAELLRVKLLEYGRKVTLLDGDVVRTYLSSGLTFSRADRDTHVRRLGCVSSEIVRHGGIVICAAISPYRTTRNEVRHMVGDDHFIEVFVDTPLVVCEQRDPKGLYVKARRGELLGFTGIDDPYELPLEPNIKLDTVLKSAEDNAQLILHYLQCKGFVRDEGLSNPPS